MKMLLLPEVNFVKIMANGDLFNTYLKARMSNEKLRLRLMEPGWGCGATPLSLVLLDRAAKPKELVWD